MMPWAGNSCAGLVEVAKCAAGLLLDNLVD